MSTALAFSLIHRLHELGPTEGSDVPVVVARFVFIVTVTSQDQFGRVGCELTAVR